MLHPDNDKEQHSAEILQSLVAFLKPHSSQTGSLKDIKMELYQYHKNYFGNLLKPEFLAQVEAFVRTTPAAGTVQDVMQALEFAFANEIERLQKCYDEEGSAESWGRSMTAEEHKVLIDHGLMSKENIKTFIKKLLKGKGNHSKHAFVSVAQPWEAAASLEPLFPNKLLFQVIHKLNPSMLQMAKPSASAAAASAAAASAAPTPPTKTIKKKITKDAGSEDSVPQQALGTRQKTKQMEESMRNAPFQALLSKCSDGGKALFSEILNKEVAMLIKIKAAAKQNKDLRPIIPLWKSGFDQVYLFWINLIISNACIRKQDFAPKITLDSFYTEEDDTHFILLVGQSQANLLHRMQFQLNHSLEDLLRTIPKDSDPDDMTLCDGSKPVPDKAAVEFPLWKSYLLLANGGELTASSSMQRRWSNNYRFVSIKLFKALRSHNLLSQCYTLLDSAFDKIHAIKDIEKTESTDPRHENFRSLCEEISKGFLRPGQGKQEGSSEIRYSWDPYWNLTAFLPVDEPLMQFYHSNSPAPSQARLQGAVTEKTKIWTDAELDAKTKERLSYWWHRQPWYHVCEQAKISMV